MNSDLDTLISLRNEARLSFWVHSTSVSLVAVAVAVFLSFNNTLGAVICAMASGRSVPMSIIWMNRWCRAEQLLFAVRTKGLTNEESTCGS